EVEVCRARETGTGGGPIEVRTLEPGRVFESAEGTRTLEGVLWRETAALGVSVCCFVGDFVGDYRQVSTYTASCNTGIAILLLCSTGGFWALDSGLVHLCYSSYSDLSLMKWKSSQRSG